MRISINNAKTIEINHYCLVTEALPRQVNRGVRSLSSLPRLRFSSHRGKFEENKMAADEVSPRAYAPILSSGTVCRNDTNLLLKTLFKELFTNKGEILSCKSVRPRKN